MVAPISGIVGSNGGGKTLCAIERHVRPALERGRTVVSTCYVQGGYALESARQLPLVSDGVLLLDEITSCFPSRGSNSMPNEVARTLNQLRKIDVDIVWTGPSFARADKILREVTTTVTVCRGYIDGRSRSVRRDPSASAWPENRLFRWCTYSTELADDFRIVETDDTRQGAKLRAKSKRWYLRPAQGGAQDLYRTLDSVLLLDHLDEFGNCFQCGGRRPRPVCTCAGQPESPPRLRTWEEVEAAQALRAWELDQLTTAES